MAIIGGGIVGTATAFYASQAGLKTPVSEKRDGLATLTTTSSLGAFSSSAYKVPGTCSDKGVSKQSVLSRWSFFWGAKVPGTLVGYHFYQRQRF